MAKPKKKRLTGSQKKWLADYGPWAVVTGASSGIGRELSIALAKRGAKVVLTGRRKEALEALAQDLQQRFGAETRIVVGDLSDPAAVTRLLDETSALDVGLLAANAGFGGSGLFIDQDIANELNMIDLNCRSVAAQAHAYARRFRTRKKSGVIFLSSIVSWQGVPKAANYAATKSYVQSLAEGLYTELKPLGIDVLATAPGPVSTGFARRADMTINGAHPRVIAENTLKALGKKRPVQPHFMGWFLSTSLAMLPRGMRIRIMTAVMSGMANT